MVVDSWLDFDHSISRFKRMLTYTEEISGHILINVGYAVIDEALTGMKKELL